MQALEQDSYAAAVIGEPTGGGEWAGFPGPPGSPSLWAKWPQWPGRQTLGEEPETGMTPNGWGAPGNSETLRDQKSDSAPALALVFLSDICLPRWHLSLVTIQHLTWPGSKEKTEPAAWRARP